ncbi:BT4734/BF3469 family protein [Mucilaginibacter psychrotolerans]|uniref:Uncharacterized protein n=1 Tax=Mucilaginibacter psychrotolerans TaxID=1524096 RepID=A0A4Y8S5X7_9SPHI|nr:BT4734/BF3469 family protein [Mucilaginibacter psychrotolerans]TFF34409.1 hypothetical protein E2R66_22300 [Mucilaginibacter psychrotolerans]
MITTLNVYDNLRTPKISNTTTIEQWFELIKQSAYSPLIESARPFGKKHPVYEANKTLIPAITYNFTFHTNKENANITGATGLLYIDVDDTTYDITLLDTSKVFAYYKSFGGLGYSVLVKVDGLSLDNYNSTYAAVLADLGLSKFYDKGAKKATQFNVLSYDPNIYINYDSFVFTAIETDSKLDIKNSPPSLIIKEKKTYIDRVGGIINSNTPLRFNNLNEIEFEGNYTFNWDGWAYVNAWLPYKKIQSGKRNPTLLSFLNNYVWLNPQLTQKGAITVLNWINQTKCEEPLNQSEIEGIVKSIFNYKAEGTLKPKYNWKTRKILFANQTGLSREQKLAICRELLAEKNQNNSLQKLNGIIAGWDFDKYGKIGQAVIYKNFRISKKTVEKYWSEFKDEVKQLNDNWKNPPVSSKKDAPVLRIAEDNTQPDTADRELLITNPERYRRGTQLLSFMERVELEARLAYLLNTGYTGEVQLEADDTLFVFNLQQDVKFVGFGESVAA